MQVNYIRLSEGLNNYKLIPETDSVWNHVESPEKDYYVSVFKYNDEQYNKWKKDKTLSGIKDVTTNKLVFDFDSSENLELAKTDAITAIERLIDSGIKENNIRIAFSGRKGFYVEVETDTILNQEQFKKITFDVAGDLTTFDRVVNDPQRIVRLVMTKHPQSKLYKCPLTFAELKAMNTEAIKVKAATPVTVTEAIEDTWSATVALPEKLKTVAYKQKEKVKKEVITHDLNLADKPRWLTQAKFALQHGFFKEGERRTAMLILASTYKNQGIFEEMAYNMLQAVADKQAARNNSDRFEDTELEKIVSEVYGPNWKGGQFPKDHPLLVQVAQELGLEIEKEESPLVTVESVSSIFKNFAENIDQNTMKLGIDKIDNNVRITTSMLVGLLGAPSSGKTTCAINFLNYASLNNTKSVFFSLDMGAPLMFQRLIQRHEGINSNDLFSMYKGKEAKKIMSIEQKIKENYSNVSFCFKAGLTPDDIKNNIIERQDITGEKIKLCVVDYLECLSGPYSDPTANTSIIAQKLKDIANELDLTLVLLLQPQKHAGDPSDELLSYRNIKGSSAIEQAASIILSVWRPGFSPKTPHQDKYLSVAVLKNRMGGLNQFDFRWNGLTGTINEMDYSDEDELHEIREAKKLADLKKDDF